MSDIKKQNALCDYFLKYIIYNYKKYNIILYIQIKYHSILYIILHGLKTKS